MVIDFKIILGSINYVDWYKLYLRAIIFWISQMEKVQSVSNAITKVAMEFLLFIGGRSVVIRNSHDDSQSNIQHHLMCLDVPHHIRTLRRFYVYTTSMISYER